MPLLPVPQSVKCGRREHLSNVLKKKKSKWFTTEGPWSVVQEVNFREKLSLYFQVAAVGRTPALPLVPFDPSD